MSKLSWYWHRLRAMSPSEMLLHGRKRLRQAADAKRTSWPEVDLTCSGAFPKLPKPEDAPEVLREALKRDVDNILAGRWRFFGHLAVQVDDPPKWQYDYLVRRDVENTTSAFKLNYRSLTDGVDSKLVWEPSRWNQLVRLAMAAYVLGDRRAGEKCVEWLEDWVKHNPPYRGWNWTSALEVGLRLIQFAWIDALLTAAMVSGSEFRVLGLESALREDGPPSPRPSPPGEGARREIAEGSEILNADEALPNAVEGVDEGQRAVAPSLLGGEGRGEGERKPQISERLERLRRAILPPHVWYAWRHKSFGSSANNHLLGELVGCIVATVRWSGLTKCGASLEELQRRWEHEVLAQFAEDGGNKEQALNYQLFSWEFCWQARMALVGAGRKISPEVDERLRRAAQFFVDVQVPSDPWDYGDSDNAFVTPLYADDRKVVAEWHEWYRKPARGQALEYWMGAARRDLKLEIPDFKAGEWRSFWEGGYTVRKQGDWTFRWDLSQLGLGSMAAHGHLDALHVSLWLRGMAMVIDPGTGAYHADKQLRNWLASRSAHSSPTPKGNEWPQRLGPFLWEAQPWPPHLDGVDGTIDNPLAPQASAELELPDHLLFRQVSFGDDLKTFTTTDLCERRARNSPTDGDAFSVRWQFAPDSRAEDLGQRRFRVTRHGVTMEVQVSADWAEVWCVKEQSQVAQADPDAPLAGTVSPAFRKTVWAPYLKLVARPLGDKPCVFSTTFLASAHS